MTEQQTEQQTAPATMATDDQADPQIDRQRRMETLGLVAGGIAHDFNNMLAVIMNYTGFVNDAVTRAAQTSPEVWQPVAADVAQILRATERGAAITHQLLSFARREVTQPEAWSLDRIIADVTPLMRRSIGEHIQVVANGTIELAPVMVDKGQVEQVLLNLALNARDAMTHGGILTIDTANITQDDGSNWVRVRVTDTGHGMPADILERCFEPFFTTRNTGTGLGLATAYGIVTEAGGQIGVDSEIGFGTVVTVLLPATNEATTPVDRAPLSSVFAPKGETVLIVEDEEALRLATARVFESAGYRTVTAPDGYKAIRVADEQFRIHLLVSDVVMPGMLGKEVAARVQARHPDCATLFMSGYARPVLAEQGRLDPGVALINKPFSSADILSWAGRVLANHTSSRAELV